MGNTIHQRTKIYSMQKCSCLFIAALIFALGISGVAYAQNPVRINESPDTGNYKIGVGDVLKIVVLKQTDLTQDNIRVSNKGTIEMPMLKGAIPATCLTETELAAELTSRYKEYILNPHIYVTVKEFVSNPVSVVGEVVAPGRFQLQRPTRLLELLAQVNGPSKNAGNEIQIIRTSNAACVQNDDPAVESPKLEIISIDLASLNKGTEDANLYVRAGDVIRVNEAELKQAFVIGSVKAAVIIDLKERVTLSRAIAKAGGVSQGAKIEKVKISRQGQNEIIVNLKEVAKGTQEDMFLQVNDVVEVPASKPAMWKTIVNSLIGISRVPVVLP